MWAGKALNQIDDHQNFNRLHGWRSWPVSHAPGRCLLPQAPTDAELILVGQEAVLQPLLKKYKLAGEPASAFTMPPKW
jgi:hypothetical protein